MVIERKNERLIERLTEWNSFKSYWQYFFCNFYMAWLYVTHVISYSPNKKCHHINNKALMKIITLKILYGRNNRNNKNKKYCKICQQDTKKYRELKNRSE